MTMPRDEHGFIKVACPTCGEQLFGVQEWSAGDPIAEAMTAELRALREENERLKRDVTNVTEAAEIYRKDRDTLQSDMLYREQRWTATEAERDTARRERDAYAEATAFIDGERRAAERRVDMADGITDAEDETLCVLALADALAKGDRVRAQTWRFALERVRRRMGREPEGAGMEGSGT